MVGAKVKCREGIGIDKIEKEVGMILHAARAAKLEEDFFDDNLSKGYARTHHTL